jgi:hypothetical protein
MYLLSKIGHDYTFSFIQFFRHEGLCIGLLMPNHCFESKQPNSNKQCCLVYTLKSRFESR